MCKMSVKKCPFRHMSVLLKKYLDKHNMANETSLYCILRYAILFF